jgi:DNA-binding LacI/PurR family transcriptional regulator
MARQVPFTVSRDDKRSLLQQVVDGLREAIVAGFYRPGELVPSYRELAPMLGVSRIVTQAALRRIADEGLVESRPRRGSVVRDPGAKQWRGHVVFVYDGLDLGYFQTVLSEELRIRLNRAGYLFSRATVEGDSNGEPCDFSNLDAALSRAVDLVVVLYQRPAIFRHLAKRGIPYAAIIETSKAPPGAVGLTHLDNNTAVPEFVAECRAANVEKVVQLTFHPQMCDAAPALRAAGIAISTLRLKPDFSIGKLLGAEKAGYVAFERLIRSRRLSRETVYFFADDYLLHGALLAMAHAGLAIPQDVRVASLTHVGLGPYFPRDLSRMEMDSKAHGAAVADAALAYLATGRYPEGSVIGPVWRRGETMFSPSGRCQTDVHSPHNNRKKERIQ